ncbi:MAG: CoA-binding protein [Candidatus Nezhaarchaeota archaeon]|nr:CoA-binding protein [Candidatus Nezhaarchaeota archaeon]
MSSGSIEHLFNPRTVALVGASEDRLKSGGMFLESFIRCGLKSKLFLVNPRGGEIRGFKVYKSVLDIPEEIDLAILAVPAHITLKVVDDCSKKGVKFVIVHAAGFGETGEEGKRMEEEMVRIARERGMRIVGPNCMGVYCPTIGLNTILPYVDGLTEESGDVAVISQSGWVCEYMIFVGYQLGLRFSKVLSIGNQSDLTFIEILDYLASDSETRIISAYIESVKDGRAFMEVAKKVTRSKPVIVWKPGKTEAAVRAILSHTGSLSGSHMIYETAFKQCGIIPAHGVEELLDFTIAFKSRYLPSGNKVGIIVGAGGAGVAASDACESLGLKVEKLPEEITLEIRDLVRGLIPPSSSFSNPIDLIWLPLGLASTIHVRIIEIVSKIVDSFIIMDYEPFAVISRDIFADQYREAILKVIDKVKKPIIFVAPHPTKDLDISSWIKNGLPVYPTPERAARALSALLRYSKHIKTRTPGLQ